MRADIAMKIGNRFFLEIIDYISRYLLDANGAILPMPICDQGDFVISTTLAAQSAKEVYAN
ncbi:hypothetical protein GL2_03620 [Microbulbifer sp. GL-2]|nr:hypothetical protein GL2_03620 [Microbulbifer sp. GL-2]